MIFFKKMDKKIHKEIDETSKNEFIERADQTQNKKEKKWVMFLLRINSETIGKIDQEIENREELSRVTKTSWILEAIQEKLKKRK